MGGCVCDVRRHFNWNRCFFSSPSSFTVCHDVSYQTFLFLKIFFSLLILTTISYHPQFSPWFVIVFLSHISSWHWSPNQHWTVLRFTLKKTKHFSYFHLFLMSSFCPSLHLFMKVGGEQRVLASNLLNIISASQCSSASMIPLGNLPIISVSQKWKLSGPGLFAYHLHENPKWLFLECQEAKFSIYYPAHN